MYNVQNITPKNNDCATSTSLMGSVEKDPLTTIDKDVKFFIRLSV